MDCPPHETKSMGVQWSQWSLGCPWNQSTKQKWNPPMVFLWYCNQYGNWTSFFKCGSNRKIRTWRNVHCHVKFPEDFFGFGHIWASRIHKDGTVLRPFLHRHPAPSHAEIHGLNTNRMRRPRVTMYPRSDFFSCSITINYLNFRHPSPFPSRQVSYLESIWEKYLGQSWLQIFIPEYNLI